MIYAHCSFFFLFFIKYFIKINRHIQNQFAVLSVRYYLFDYSVNLLRLTNICTYTDSHSYKKNKKKNNNFVLICSKPIILQLLSSFHSLLTANVLHLIFIRILLIYCCSQVSSGHFNNTCPSYLSSIWLSPWKKCSFFLNILQLFLFILFIMRDITLHNIHCSMHQHAFFSLWSKWTKTYIIKNFHTIYSFITDFILLYLSFVSKKAHTHTQCK